MVCQTPGGARPLQTRARGRGAAAGVRLTMAKSFVPESPLEKLVYQGKRDEVVGLLRGLGATERQKLRGEVARLVKITQAARFAFSDDTFAGWGRLPTDEQLRAIAVAALL